MKTKKGFEIIIIKLPLINYLALFLILITLEILFSFIQERLVFPILFVLWRQAFSDKKFTVKINFDFISESL